MGDGVIRGLTAGEDVAVPAKRVFPVAPHRRPRCGVRSKPWAGVLLFSVGLLPAAVGASACDGDPVLECGDERSAPSGGQAIVNGSAAWDASVVALSADQAEAVVAIYLEGWGNTCTGTLVAPERVLTAAHCVRNDEGTANVPASDVWVAFGPDAGSALATIDVSALHTHPEYDDWGETSIHDVAILELSESATDHVPNVVPLPYNCDPIDDAGLVGQEVQTVGFGDTAGDGTSSNEERWWAVEEVDELISFDVRVNGDELAGVCYGDSGGPLLWTMPGGEIRSLGILSWGETVCGGLDHYVRTDAECDFIEGNGSGCNGETEVGRCTEDGRAVYCDGALVVTLDCATQGAICGPTYEGTFRCLPICDQIGVVGACEGDDVIWCEAVELRRRRCADCEQLCGWSERRGVYYCQ